MHAGATELQKRLSGWRASSGAISNSRCVVKAEIALGDVAPQQAISANDLWLGPAEPVNAVHVDDQKMVAEGVERADVAPDQRRSLSGGRAAFLEKHLVAQSLRPADFLLRRRQPSSNGPKRPRTAGRPSRSRIRRRGLMSLAGAFVIPLKGVPRGHMNFQSHREAGLNARCAMRSFDDASEAARSRLDLSAGRSRISSDATVIKLQVWRCKQRRNRPRDVAPSWQSCAFLLIGLTLIVFFGVGVPLQWIALGLRWPGGAIVPVVLCRVLLRLLRVRLRIEGAPARDRPRLRRRQSHFMDRRSGSR